MKRTVLSIMLCLIGLTSWSQAWDITIDLEKVRKAYLKLDNYKVDIDYNEYDKANGGSLVSSHKGNLKKKGELYSMKVGDQTVVNGRDMAIVMNDQEKLMVAMEPQSIGFSGMTDVPVGDLLKLSSEYSKIDNLKPGLRGYRFEFIAAEYEAIEVIFNHQSGHLNKIILYAHEHEDDAGNKTKKRLEIEYGELLLEAEFTSKDFDTSSFITEVNGAYKPSQKFQEYTLIDQTRQ